MQHDVLQYILSGEAEWMIREIIASHMGRTYRNHFVNTVEDKKKLRKDILAFYYGKEQKSEASDLLGELADYDNEKIQNIIRYVDNETFVAALSGASNKVCVKFLSNLSDRLLYFIDEDIRQYHGTEEEMIKAQRSLLKSAMSFLQK